jgi:AraC family transcriptional regulator
MGQADVFAFNVELAAHWVTRTGLCREPAELTGGAAVECARRLYREFRDPDDVSPLAIESVILELAVAVSRGQVSRFLPPVARACRLIDARFLEPLRIEEIAREVDLSPAALVQAFRRRYDCSPGDYLRALRIAEAKRLLASSDRSLCQIATACGFADQSHMTRLFKRACSVTPAVYRRLVQ